MFILTLFFFSSLAKQIMVIKSKCTELSYVEPRTICRSINRMIGLQGNNDFWGSELCHYLHEFWAMRFISL